MSTCLYLAQFPVKTNHEQLKSKLIMNLSFWDYQTRFDYISRKLLMSLLIVIIFIVQLCILT